MTRTKFNWLTTLRRLAKRKTPIGYRERLRLRTKAQRWPTCACGQLCKALPKNHSGSPCDHKAQILGCAFTCQIFDDRFSEALRTFLKIEKRTAMLLRKGGGGDD